jgi:hypothetical protein
VDCTGLARPTVSSVLRRLEAAGIVVREEERFAYASLTIRRSVLRRFTTAFRAPFTTYSFTRQVLDRVLERRVHTGLALWRPLL